NPGIPPGTAALTKQVKQPITQAAVDTTIQPVQNNPGTSNPELLQHYRQKLTPFGLAGLRTKPLESGVWEAIAHFPLPDDPSQLRRIETQGMTEADALQAILEQIEKR
ncbi:MAG TPA: hypothetical protein PKA06_00750, partial [Gemmatales bacterium]|nr:hypothetical protein [Gemmatales bacterium]